MSYEKRVYRAAVSQRLRNIVLDNTKKLRGVLRCRLLLCFYDQPRSIPGSTMGIFLEGEDSHGDRGLSRSVEFRFKAPPGTTSFSITTHTPSGQHNCASWASQPQKSVTLLPCPGGRTTKSTKGHVVALGGGNYVFTQ